MKQRNGLTQAQSFRLAKWAEATFDELRGLAIGEIAQRASNTLGFPVTIGNVQGLEEVLGVRFNPRKPPAGPASDLIAILAKDNIDLRHALGQPVSDQLKALAGLLV